MLRKIAFVILAVAALSGLLMAGQTHKFTFGTIQIGPSQSDEPVPGKTIYAGVPAGIVRILGRDETQIWVPNDSVDYPVPDVLNGRIIFVINCNFDANLRGPCWGTFKWEVDSGGVWEGIWRSPVMDLITYESEFSMVGHGSGGAIEGKQLMFEGGSAPGDWYITGTVRIK